MIISHRHRFIFIKPKKVAGTSIEIALSRICGPEDVLTPLGAKDEKQRQMWSNLSAQNYRLSLWDMKRQDIFSLIAGKPYRFRKHMTAEQMRVHLTPKIWNDYFKFTVERNPFDKVVSLYYWRGGPEKYGTVNDFLKNGGLRNCKSYDAYSINEIVAVDKVYPFEDLDSMCEELSAKFDIDQPVEMPIFKAKSNTRKVKSYKDIVDEEARELIEIAFAREIKLMGYSF